MLNTGESYHEGRTDLHEPGSVLPGGWLRCRDFDMGLAVVIEARALGKSFGPVHALRAIDLSVREGESVAIFGPNGAGKTTLLRVLAGLVSATRGDLSIFGHTAGHRAIRHEVGFVSHGTSLYDDLTAVENLELFGRLFGLSAVAPRIDRLLADLGLESWRNRPVRSFSRGMQQRLALARAFLHEPRLLLLDEPYSGLDPQAVARLQHFLVTRHAAGTTIVLTTHDIACGLEVCDHAMLLAGGRDVWRSGRFVPGLQEMSTIYEREIGGAG